MRMIISYLVDCSQKNKNYLSKYLIIELKNSLITIKDYSIHL